MKKTQSKHGIQEKEGKMAQCNICKVQKLGDGQGYMGEFHVVTVDVKFEYINPYKGAHTARATRISRHQDIICDGCFRDLFKGGRDA
jgi:hypothetical protein